MKRMFIATVQIAFEVDDEAGNPEDFLSALLSENNEVFDWTYLKIGGQFLYPNPVLKGLAVPYEEGAVFQ